MIRLVLAAALLSTTGLLAQQMPGRILEAGLGASPSRGLAASPAGDVALIDVTQATQAKRVGPQLEKAGAIRVGSTTALTGVSADLHWRALPDGKFSASFKLRSAAAAGLRARLSVPRNAGLTELRVHGGNGGVVEVQRVTGVEQALWTPYTESEMQVIELIAWRTNAARLEIAEVVHFDVSLLADPVTSLAKEASGSCNPDVSCPTGNTALDAAITERKKSVMRINFSSGGGSFMCSGTLINSDRFPRPYVLTANHCIASAQEAASVATFWFRENVSCGAKDTVGGQVQVSGGAQVSFTNGMVDSSLLEMNLMPPAGTVYAGWDAALLTNGAAVVSISHPQGDPMKYARGSVTEEDVRAFDRPYGLYGVSFTQGVTEPGSSGSGLFTVSATSGLQLRGILSGSTIRQPGGLRCTNLNDLALYGRFEVFYQNIRQIISNAVVPAVDIDANQPAGARTLALGGSLTARIDYAGDLDVFRVDVTQPGNLTVRTTGGIDTVGELLNAAGQQLQAEDDAEIGSFDFGLTRRVEPGTYYVNIGHFEPGATSTDYQVLASFSTATENYSDIWWNASESGWGLALNHQDNTLVGALYTYDIDGAPLYFIVGGAQRNLDGSYEGPLQRFRGPAFNSVPWQSGQVAVSQAGSIRIVFSGRSNAQISYTIGGQTVVKSITRLIYGTQPTCTFSAFDRSWATQFQDVWWNPAEPGWGINIIQQGNIASAGLYTYDATGRDAWYLMGAGSRSISGNAVVFEGDLARSTGPAFFTTPWPLTSVSNKVGSMRLAFTEGNKGTLTYTIGTSPAVVKQIERFTFSPLRTVCKNN